jgi:hypothetical protein
MNGRFLLVGTLVAAVTLFAWQTVSNVALPWHEQTMQAFGGGDSVVKAIRAAAPVNGVYWSPQGVLAAVSMTPDLADKSTGAFMGRMMGRQLVIDLLMGYLLCLLFTRLPAASALHTGRTFAIAGLAAGLVLEFSNWNWYGFAANFALVNMIDLTLQFFLGGVALALLSRRIGVTPEAAVSVPSGAGYRAKPADTPSRML